MRGVDLFLIFLLATFFLVVGLMTGSSAFFKGHFGTGIVMAKVGAGGFLALALAVLIYFQRDRTP